MSQGEYLRQLHVERYLEFLLDFLPRVTLRYLIRVFSNPAENLSDHNLAIYALNRLVNKVPVSVLLSNSAIHYSLLQGYLTYRHSPCRESTNRQVLEQSVTFILNCHGGQQPATGFGLGNFAPGVRAPVPVSVHGRGTSSFGLGNNQCGRNSGAYEQMVAGSGVANRPVNQSEGRPRPVGCETPNGGVSQRPVGAPSGRFGEDRARDSSARILSSRAVVRPSILGNYESMAQVPIITPSPVQSGFHRIPERANAVGLGKTGSLLRPQAHYAGARVERCGQSGGERHYGHDGQDSRGQGMVESSPGQSAPQEGVRATFELEPRHPLDAQSSAEDLRLPAAVKLLGHRGQAGVSEKPQSNQHPSHETASVPEPPTVRRGRPRRGRKSGQTGSSHGSPAIRSADHSGADGRGLEPRRTRLRSRSPSNAVEQRLELNIEEEDFLDVETVDSESTPLRRRAWGQN